MARLPSTCAGLVDNDTMHPARRNLANDRPIIDRRVGISSVLSRSPRLSDREAAFIATGQQNERGR